MSASLASSSGWLCASPACDPAEKASRFADCIAVLAAGRKRMMARDRSGVAFDVTDYILALVRANRGWQEPAAGHHSLFLTSGRAAAVQVGEQVFRAIGRDGVVAVRDCIAALLPLGAAADLDMVWQDIGGVSR